MTEPSVGVEISGGVQSGIIGAATVSAGQIIINNYPTHVAEPVAVAKAIGPCPYPGLAYFGPDDAKRFFGRDDATGKLATAVGRQTLTALVGASGSGKSSVVLAGLAPRLHEKGEWLFSYFRIGDEVDHDPFLALARSLAPLYVTSTDDTERLKNVKSLAKGLRMDELTLRDVFADCRSKNKGVRILLIADQFEETFTLVQDEATRSRFIEVLLSGFPAFAPESDPDICLVLTLRADFYGRALMHRNLADALQGRVENLGPMNREELRSAIVRPAENAGVTFEIGLIETLLDKVEGNPASLPLLQFALREMWWRQEQRQITRRSYDDIRGVEGALAQRAEMIFKSMTEEESNPRMVQAFQRLFTRLVTLGEGQEDTRRVVDRQELGADGWLLAQRLAGEDNRLIVTNGPPASSRETAEVIHEALIRNWPRLVGWINGDRAFQAWVRRIRSNAELWSHPPSDDGLLLRGGQLAQAVEWLAVRRTDLSQSEAAYVDASVARQRREEDEEEAARQGELRRQKELADSRLRQRWAAVAAAFVFVLIAGVTVWQRGRAVSAEAEAVAQRDAAQHQTRLAVSRQFAAVALGHVDDSLDLSLLLGLEALNAADTFEARSALFSGIAHYPRIERYLRGQIDQIPMGARYTRAFGLATSPNGAMLASVSNSQKGIHLFDPRTGSLVRVLGPDTDFAEAVAFSHDGKVLLSGGDDQKLRLWNASDGTLLTASAEFPETVTAVAFGARPDVVYCAAGDKLSRWKWRDAAPVESFADPRLRTIERVFVSADDKYAVVSGYSSGSNSNERLTVWIDLATGKGLNGTKSGSAIAIGPSGKLIALSQPDGVQVYNVNSRAPLGPPMKAGDDAELVEGAFSPKGDLLATSLDTKVVVWDLKTGTVAGDPWSGHIEAIDALVFDPDGEHLTSLAGDNAIISWSVAAPRKLARRFAASEGAWTLAFSPTSPILASVADTSTTLWDTKSGKVSAVLKTPDFPEADASFSADGRMLLLSDSRERDEKNRSPQAAAVFDMQNHERVLSLPDGARGGPLAISPDGSQVALVDGLSRVLLWNTSTHAFSPVAATASADISAVVFAGPNQLAIGDVRGGVVVCGLSPSPAVCRSLENISEAPLTLLAIPSKDLLIATGHETIYLWSLSTGNRIRKLIDQASASIGSPAIAAVSSDAELIAWSAFGRSATEILDSKLTRTFGQKLDAAGEGESSTTGLAFSPDGKVFATAHSGDIFFWDFDVASWRRRACAIANRNLTRAEWARYFSAEPYRKTCENIR